MAGRQPLNPAYGKINLKRRLSCAIPEHIWREGKVASAAAFSDFIRKLWSEYELPKSSVSLVLDGSQFVVKLFSMPPASAGKTIEYISREFSDVERASDPVFSYLAISENPESRTRKILAVMAERSFIRLYMDIFDKAGLKLVSVSALQSSVVSLLSRHPGIAGRTCLVQHVGNGELTSVFFVEGMYTYFSRSGFPANCGPVDLAMELSRAGRRILQFAKAQGIERAVTDVFLIGASESDFFVFCESVRQLEATLAVGELSCDPLFYASSAIEGPPRDRKMAKKDDPFGEFFCAASGFEAFTGKSGFIYQQKRDIHKEERGKRFLKYSAPFIAAPLILLVWTFALYRERQLLTASAEKAAQFLGNEKLKSAAARYDEYSALINDVSARVSAIKAAKAAVDSYPVMNSTVYEALTFAAPDIADISVVSYDSATGLVGLICVCSDEALIHRCVQALKSSECLIEVRYSGYELNEDGTYSAELSCYLAPEAGRTGQKEKASGPGYVVPARGLRKMITFVFTDRDKRLLVFTAALLICLGLWRCAILPLRDMNRQLRALADSEAQKCEELAAKCEALKAAESEYERLASEYAQTAKNFYPMMEADAADALLTGIAEECGLKILSFSVVFPEAYASLVPYKYSAAALGWEGRELKGIRVAAVSMKTAGFVENILRYTGQLGRLGSLRVVSLSLLKGKAAEGEKMKEISQCKLEIELYMCESIG